MIVPDQADLWLARNWATPIRFVMWMSWPQACITPVVAAVVVLDLHLRGVGQAGVLDDRQRVEIGPQHERGAGAILENAHDAVAADAGVHFDAGLFPKRGQAGGRLLFLRGKLGLLVQLAIEFDQFADVFLRPNRPASRPVRPAAGTDRNQTRAENASDEA